MAYYSCCFEGGSVRCLPPQRSNFSGAPSWRASWRASRKADGDAAHGDARARACGACGGARAAYLRALRRRRLRAALPVSRQPTACGPATCVECGLHPARAAQLGRCRRLLRRAPANPRALCRSAIRLRVRPPPPVSLAPHPLRSSKAYVYGYNACRCGPPVELEADLADSFHIAACTGGQLCLYGACTGLMVSSGGSCACVVRVGTAPGS